MKLYRLLPAEQARQIAGELSGWKEGLARTRELTGTVKQNEEILGKDAPNMSRVITTAILTNANVQLECIPLKIHPPKFSRYAGSSHYNEHTDAPWMGDVRTDLSCTLWLNDDYDGGELCIGGEKYKGQAGVAAIYNCEMPHSVAPVTRGERICAITWMQSRIRDPHKRGLVTDFRKFLSKIEDDQRLFVEGGRIHSALIRMWME